MHETPEPAALARSEPVLVVAGYDPSGGAGLDVDRDAARALCGEVRCVATALTDQTSEAVRAVGARNAAVWSDEVRAVWRRAGGFAAVKLGLLPGVEHVRAAARLVSEWRSERDVAVVVDPVIASSSGFEFLDEEGRRALLRELAPRGVVLTPNLDELALLTGRDRAELELDIDLRARAGRDLLDLGAAAVVVKGGHGGEDPVCDLVLEPGRRAAWRTRERVRRADGTPASARGTGCRFATALAVGLASGLELEFAVDQAGRLVAAHVARATAGREEGVRSSR